MNKVVNTAIANPFGSGRAGPQDEPVFDPKTHKPNKTKSGDGYGVPNENPMDSKCGPMNDSRAPRTQALRFSASASLYMAAKAKRATPPTPELPEENGSDSSGDLYGPDGATPGGIDPERGSDSHYEETYEGGSSGGGGDFLG